MTPRIMKEVRAARLSTEYDFFMDESGSYIPDEINNCYLRWTPKTGLYAGQTHIIRFKFYYGSNEPKSFPRNPPNCVFLTPLWHTNIAPGGSICVDILKENSSDLAQSWSPIYGVDAIFHSIELLLLEPNPSSPFNAEASRDHENAKRNGDMTPFATKAEQYYRVKLGSMSEKDVVRRLLVAPEFTASRHQ